MAIGTMYPGGIPGRDSLKKKEAKGSMADVTTGTGREYASVAEVRADLERAGGDASVLCGFGRCFCVKTALGIRRKERGHWPQFQESERSNRVLLGTAIAAFDSLESGAKDSSIRQTMVWLLSEGAT